jgi:methyl-accepting chemotaxis protein
MITINIYQHGQGSDQLVTKNDLVEINNKLNKIMASQADIAGALNETATKVQKIAEETRSLLTKIEELTTAIENQGDVSPELQTAVDNLNAQVEVVDQLVPDPENPPTDPEQPVEGRRR